MHRFALVLLPAVVALSVPSTNTARQHLLQSKRPIGRRQLGPSATSWLREEMRVKADAYLAEVLFADPTDDRQERLTGRALAENFSPQQLEAHLLQRLEESDVSVGPAHELAAQHTPTLWAAFVVSVQTVLQHRIINGTLANTTEWRVFLHTQHHARPTRRNARPHGARKGAASRADNARARDAARRASLRPASDSSVVRRQPYGKQALGGEAVMWLRRAGAVCADEYCTLAAEARTEKLSGLVDVFGPGQAGKHAVLSALNTEEAVSAAAVTMAAELLSSKSLQEYRDAFERIDTDGSGFIDRPEVERLLQEVYGEEAASAGVAAFLANFNADKEGKISWEVFAAALCEGATAIEGCDVEADTAAVDAARGATTAASEMGGEAWERLLYEAILAQARPRFSVLQLAYRFHAELEGGGAQPQLATRDLPTGFDLRGHVPTLWGVFIRAVRLRLQVELGPQWSVSTEWRVLMALYAEASAAPGMRWQLPDAARQETVVGKVVPKPFRKQRRTSRSHGEAKGFRRASLRK